MTKILKQSTAVTIKMGPFVDETDGKTAETALTLSQADFRLTKNGGDFAQKNDTSSGTHDEIGYYDVPLNTTDTNTLGLLKVSVHESGALPVWDDFLVVPAVVYDSLVAGSDNLQVDVVQLAGVTQSLTDLKDFADDGYDPSTNKVQGVVLCDTLTTYTGNTPQTGDGYAIVASGTHGNAALKTLIDTLDDLVDTEVAAIKAKTDNLPTDPADASDIASAFTSLNTKVDTIDDFLDTEIAAIKAKTDNLPSDPADASDVASAFSTVNSNLSTIAGYLDTEIAAILADTDELQTKWNTGGTLKTELDTIASNAGSAASGISSVGSSVDEINAIAAKIDTAMVLDGAVYQFTTNALELAPSGSGLDAAGVRAAVGLASANLDTQLSAIDDFLDTEVAAIKAKTDLISEVYHADIDLRIDDANARDDYRVIWWKDGDRITSAITVPKIQVIKEDATDLVAESAMTANGYTFTYRADGAERLTAGQSVEVLVTATINGGTRTFSAVLGRDSA